MELQRDLFADDQGIQASLLGIEGLTYVPSFLDAAAHDETLATVDSLPWQNDLKRRVQHYGYKYDYKARAIDRSMFVGELPSFAQAIGLRLFQEGHMPEVPDQLIVNEYRPGQGIAAHVDCVPCFDGTIVTISLGSVYDMDFKNLESGAAKQATLELGSALIMSGDARFSWTHGIRPRLSDNGRRRDRRVSLTFRKVILI